MCFGLVLISAGFLLPWSGLKAVDLLGYTVRPACLVCFGERPAVRFVPLRFVLYVCIVNRTLYKVKRKLYIFLSL